MLQLIIPAYNEEGRLGGTLRELRAHLSRPGTRFAPVEVIVVDNASTDRTAEVARLASSPALPVTVIHCAERGKGAAVRCGVAATTADVVGFMDADGATGLAALDEAWRLLASGSDAAVGSRALAGSVTAARHSWARETGARLYRRIAARIVPGVVDTQCGFKVIAGDLARAVFPSVRATGFSFDVELLARLRLEGAQVTEFPVAWVDVPGSTFSPVRHGLSAFSELASIGWRLRGSRRVPVATRIGVPVAIPGQVAVAQG